MFRRLPRLTLFALLCAAIVVTSWLLLPSQSEHAARNPAASGEAAGDASGLPTDERSGRVSRDQRPKPSSGSPTRDSPTSARQPKGDAALEAAVIDLLNVERDKAGCGAVRYEEQLRTAARAHSADMARREKLSHEGSDGSSPWDRAKRAGYTQAKSENIAMGYETAREVVDAWMKSEGHRENMLDCDAYAVGVGLARADDGTPYWTQMFGRA
ncbi:MAG: CAP domain-containing protein [Micromonosporaceae bacterium]